MGAADVDRLGDRLGAVGLARMDRHVDVVVPNELEGRLVVLGRVVVLGAGQIEADDAAVLVSDRQLCHFERMLRGHVSDAANDDVRLDSVSLLRSAEPLEHTLDDRRQPEPAPGVQHRRVAHLHVTDVLARRVFGELVRNAPERFRALHHAQGHVEGFQVLDEASAVLAKVHGLAQPVGISRGQVDPLSLGEFEDGRQAQRSVEMNVQVGLRELLDDLE